MARSWLRILTRIAWLENVGAIERPEWSVVDEARAEEARGRAMEGQGQLPDWFFLLRRSRRGRRRI
ncbi:MAG: hypothetical protein V3U53_07215 [bacterium]